MERQELLELVASLNAKNTALEEEIKRLEKQTDRLWEDLKEYNKDDEEFDFDYDEEDRQAVFNAEDPNYPTGDDQKINAINSRLNGTNSRVVELEKRMAMSDLEFSELKSEIRELDRWAVAQGELADRVNELLEEKEDNDGK
jgi:chaperonin cofactor prefoldin